ncbi:hypothetical protein BJ165DRAFT_130800 [Panaeolus papilionaceus]|nr:hypothetical protein BJ165DRAFT_130800 [Panaeolus papilionaceus]
MLATDLASRLLSYVISSLYHSLSVDKFEVVLSAVSSYMEGWSDFRVLLSKISLGFAIATFLWICVLLFYINRPHESHILTKKPLHLASFILLTLSWLALGITTVTFTTLSEECTFMRDSDGQASIWCGIAAATGSAGVFIAISSLISAVRVYRAEVGPDGNVSGPLIGTSKS